MNDQTAGRMMVGVAATGVVVALLGAVIGWNLLGRLDAAAGETLELTATALVTIEETVAVADSVVGSTVQALDAVELALGEIVETAEVTQPLLESVADLGAEIAPNLESVAATLRSLEDLGGSIDDVLSAIGELPFVPGYDSDSPLAAQFGRLADDIEPLAATLRETTDRLGPTADQTAELQVRLAELEAAVGAVRDDLAKSDALLAEYAATTRVAAALTDQTRSGLSSDIVAARILILIGAATFAASQIVPFWFGRALLDGSLVPTPVVPEP